MGNGQLNGVWKGYFYMQFIPYLLGLIMIVNIILAFTVIFLERKDASSTWAWLMVLFFIPIAGFILYLIFGRKLSRQRIFTWDTKSRLGVKKEVQSQLRSIEEGTFTFKHDNLIDYKDLYYLHLRNDDAIYTQDNSVSIFTDGREKFQALLDDLEKAEDHIHLLYYIMRSDQLGNAIADVLVKKAQEGVEVRVLYDDMGSRLLSKKFIRRLRKAGVHVGAFFPPKIPKINFKINFRNHRKLAIIDGQIGYIGGFNIFDAYIGKNHKINFKINFINKHKLAIIDGYIGYIGGFNIGDEYLGKNHKFGYWRDTHLRVSGKAVRNMQTRFILDWNQASRNHILYEERFYGGSGSSDLRIQIFLSAPALAWGQIQYGYIKMIMSAKEYIYIQTPYFIPDHSLMDAIRVAALSGVKVKIMIPNKPDHPFVYWATFSHIGDMLRAGAEAYIYQNGFLHAKTIVVDGKVSSVGTANIDVRSFRLNFEVNAFLYDKEIAEDLVEALDRKSVV